MGPSTESVASYSGQAGKKELWNFGGTVRIFDKDRNDHGTEDTDRGISMEAVDLRQLRVLGRRTRTGLPQCPADVRSGANLSAAPLRRGADEYQPVTFQPGLSGVQTLAQTAVIFQSSQRFIMKYVFDWKAFGGFLGGLVVLALSVLSQKRKHSSLSIFKYFYALSVSYLLVKSSHLSKHTTPQSFARSLSPAIPTTISITQIT